MRAENPAFFRSDGARGTVVTHTSGANGHPARAFPSQERLRLVRTPTLAALIGLATALHATEAQAQCSYCGSPLFHLNYASPIFPSPYGPYLTGYGLDFRYGYGPIIGDPLPSFYFSLPDPTPPPAAYGPWYTQPGPGFFFYYRK